MKQAVLLIIGITLGIASMIGWGMCIYKFVTCDFDAPYKAEAIYGIGALTGLGSIIGYVNIQD